MGCGLWAVRTGWRMHSTINEVWLKLNSRRMSAIIGTISKRPGDPGLVAWAGVRIRELSLREHREGAKGAKVQCDQVHLNPNRFPTASDWVFCGKNLRRFWVFQPEATYKRRYNFPLRQSHALWHAKALDTPGPYRGRCKTVKRR